MRPIVVTSLLAILLLAAPIAAAQGDASSSAGDHRSALSERLHSLLDACHSAAKPGDNATGAEHASWAHCVRDHVKAFFTQWRADHAHGQAKSHKGA